MEELALRAQNGDADAYTQLFKDTERIIYKFARKYSMNEENYEDLVSLGLVLFCKAVREFDPVKGRFTTKLGNVLCYGFINHSTRIQRQSLRIPASWAEGYNKLNRYKNEFFTKTGKYPTDEECIEFLRVTKNTYLNIKSVKEFRNKVSIDETINDISNNNTEIEAINRVMVSHFLEKSKLTDRENEIIQYIYFYELTVIELAKKLRISRNAIYEFKNKALKKMRNLLNSQIGKEM